jgi:hypothetical protein
MIELAMTKVWPKFYDQVGGKETLMGVVEELEKAREMQK